MSPVTTPEARTLVTCLMVTRLSRFAHLVESTADYCKQSHERRELVIITNSGPAAELDRIADHIGSLRRSDIRLVVASGAPTLGSLRNRGLDEAGGEVICQWDDDDRHHPARIDEQLGALRRSGRQACFLQDVFQFFTERRLLYWTNWSMTLGQVHPGSLMAERRAGLHYPESGPSASAGEDLAVLTDLLKTDGVHALAGAPQLFVYTTHCANTWPASHHRMLADRLSLSRSLLLRREGQIRAGLNAFDFGLGEIAVTGFNGTAFTIHGNPSRSDS